MSYCTATDIKLEAGTSLGTVTDADIGNLIIRSDAEITDYLSARRISAPGSSSLLTTASISLTIAKIKRRQAQELSRTNSLSVEGLSYSVSPEAEAAACEARAEKAMERYIVSVNGLIMVSSTTGGR